MKSDVASLEESGGESAAPEVVKLDAVGSARKAEKETPGTPKTPAEPDVSLEEELKIPGYTGTEESVFSPSVDAESKEKQEKPADAPQEGAGGRKKGILIIAIILFVVLGLGSLGYFVVYPLVFQKDEPTAVVPPPPPPVETPPPPVEPPAVPTPDPAPPVEPPPPAHTSLFLSSPALTLEVSLTETTKASVLSALSEQAAQLKNDEVAEVILTDSEKSPLSFSQVLTLLFPEFEGEDLNIFKDDFTLYVLKKDDVAWPGIIGQLEEPGLTLATAQTIAARFEAPDFASLSGLFVSDPGNAAVDGFNDGSAGNLTTRYVTFEQAGAALNYGVSSKGEFVISTSYSSIVEATSLMKAPVEEEPAAMTEESVVTEEPVAEDGAPDIVPEQ